jgi:TonB family protein
MKAGGAPTVASNQVEGGPEIFSVGNGVTEPVPIYKPDPGYTQEARVAKLEGTVILSVIIGVDGDVTDVKVVKGLDKGLTERAVDTVRTWKFNPALKAGKPVPCRVTVEVSFRMF